MAKNQIKRAVQLPTLEECEAGARAAHRRVHQIVAAAERSTRVHLLVTGLWLLKAQEVLALENDGSRNPNGRAGKESCATVAQDSRALAPTCFNEFLQAESTGVSRRTAYNYMNAALNKGLTARSTEEEAMRMGPGLETLTAAEWRALYTSPAAFGAEAPQPPAPRVPVQSDFDHLLLGVSDLKEKFAGPEDRERVPEEVRVGIARELLDALRAVTGEEWGIIEGGRP